LSNHEALEHGDQGGGNGAAVGLRMEFAGTLALFDQIFEIGAVPPVIFREGVADGFAHRRGGAQGEKLKPEAEGSAMPEARTEASLTGAVEKLAGGQITRFGEHGFLAFNNSGGIKLIHAEHELFLAFEIEIRGSPGQPGGIGDIRHSAVVETFPGERRHGGVHQFGLHSGIITLFRHALMLAKGESDGER
jgi:hypothetical protein